MLNECLTFLLSGGVVSLLIGVFTLRAKVRKAQAETEAAVLQNTASATRILMENIVEPLKNALDETRKDLHDTKEEMRQLREAIHEANSCRYSGDCPVLDRMRHTENGAGLPS